MRSYKEKLGTQKGEKITIDPRKNETMGETKEKSQIIDFLGGFFGGVASTYIGHPLDTVKVRMQVSQISSTTVISYSNAHQNLSLNILPIVLSIGLVHP